MNTIQKRAIIVGIALIALAMLIPPCERFDRQTGYQGCYVFLLALPQNNVHIDFQRLRIYWFLIALGVAGVYVYAMKQKPPKEYE